jgi:hypothetical protein
MLGSMTRGYVHLAGEPATGFRIGENRQCSSGESPEKASTPAGREPATGTPTCANLAQRALTDEGGVRRHPPHPPFVAAAYS